MLGSIDLNSKSYEQLREEAVEQVPIYSREWTNYNVSDPGITILENFSAFMALQQSEINEVPEKIKWKLLALAGFRAQKGNAAKAFVLPETGSGNEAAGQGGIGADCRKLYAQDICFETERAADTETGIKDMRIMAVKAEKTGGDNTDMLLDKQGVKGGLALLGERPSGGETVYFYLKDIPDPGQKAAIYFELAQQYKRTRITGDYHNPFARIRWEIRTREGYAPIAKEDNTYCFLQSGYVVFTLDRENYAHIAKSREEDAYIIRLTAEKADYDMAPLITRICGLLVQAVQKDTRSEVMALKIKNDICVRNELLKNGYLELYGKESDGLYHRYYDTNALRAGARNEKGGQMRGYRTEYIGDHAVRLLFDTACPQEILAVCRDETMMAYRNLGILYGYDGQIMRLPDDKTVYAQDVSVLVVEKKGTGDAVCHVVEPESQTAGEVQYSVSEKENIITVHDCGNYEGAQLRLGNFASYMGSDGNIRAGTELFCEQDDQQVRFVSCTDTTDGRYEESFEEARRRFASDVECCTSMVTKADCEQIVKNIPGLCIHKIGVFAVAEKNEIHIAVKPDSSKAFPRLSGTYQREIEKYLEKYRMLTTRIVIEQPVYVPLHVTAAVCFKRHFGNCDEKVESALREMLDGIHSDACFGSRIVFHELYRHLEEMDCVEEVRELMIVPDNYHDAETAGLDIRLKPNALYYSGRIRVESISNGA